MVNLIFMNNKILQQLLRSFKIYKQTEKSISNENNTHTLLSCKLCKISSLKKFVFMKNHILRH